MKRHPESAKTSLEIDTELQSPILGMLILQLTAYHDNASSLRVYSQGN